MRPLVLAFAALCALFIAACGDSMGRGMMITGQGKVGANSDRNQREAAQDALTEAISDLLGKDWTVATAIVELPEWVESTRGGQAQDGDWRWERITATVTLSGASGAKLAEAKRSEIEQGSRDYLLRKLRQRNPAMLAVSVQVKETAVAVVPAPTVLVPMPPAGSTARSYAIQPGDTIADISSAFFGTPNHWRTIVAANPGLDPAALRPGQQIVIPVLPPPVSPAPAPAPPAAPAPAPAPAPPAPQ